MRSFTVVILAASLLLAVFAPGPAMAQSSSADAQLRSAEAAVRSAESQLSAARAGLAKAQSAVTAAERRLASARADLARAQAMARAQASSSRMPKLVGMEMSQAGATLNALPITLRRVPTPAATGDPRIGQIVAQTPPAGAPIRRGMVGQIVYLVARPAVPTPPAPTAIVTPPTPPAPPAPTAGPVPPTPPAPPVATLLPRPPAPRATVTVPQLIGRTIAEAAGLASKSGLQPRTRAVTLQPRDTRAGRVVAQSPRAGTRVPQKTTVSITYGKAAPRPTTVKMPNLIGKTQGQATAVLRGLGLAAAYKRSVTTARTLLTDKVVAQTPKAGTVMKAGQKGYFTIQVLGNRPTPRIGLPRPAATFDMPDLMNKKLEEARAILTKMALTRVMTRKIKARKADDVGKVVIQSPKAGSTVSRSATIYLTVAVQ